MPPRTERLTNVRSWKGAVMNRVRMVHRGKRHAARTVVVTSQIESDLMANGVRALSAGDGRLRQLNGVAMHRVVTVHPVKRHAVKRHAARMAVAMSQIVIDLIASVDRTSRDDPMDRHRDHRETVLTAPDRNAPRKGE